MISWPATALLMVLLLQSAGVPNSSKIPPSKGQEITTLKQKADSGDPKAQVELGVVYASGDGVPADQLEAVKWFRNAAEQGDAAGEYSLGEMYLSGRGLPVDYAAGGWPSLSRVSEMTEAAPPVAVFDGWVPGTCIRLKGGDSQTGNLP